jgi:hypothetical protein
VASASGYLSLMVVRSVRVCRTLRAIAFTAANHTCADYELPPSTRYKDIVLKGARESGLDARWIAHLEKIPAAAPTPPVKLLCACYLALSAVLFRLTGGFAGLDAWWARGIRTVTGAYRDLLKVAYRISLPGRVQPVSRLVKAQGEALVRRRVE